MLKLLMKESTKYTVAKAYERGYAFELGSDSARVFLYLAQRFELNA